MNNGFEGIHHNVIWPDNPEPEPEPPPSFEYKMDAARNSLRKKIEELIRARDNRGKKNGNNGDMTTEGSGSTQ
jgi:hypothetical protein